MAGTGVAIIMKTGSGHFDSLLPQLKLFGFRYLFHSPDCSHEVWRRFSGFVTVPRQCKSPHTVKAILDFMNAHTPGGSQSGK